MDTNAWFIQQQKRQFLADIYREELEEERRLTFLGKSNKPKKPCGSKKREDFGNDYQQEKLEGF